MDNSNSSFHLRFLGEQVLHNSYSPACYGWLAQKLASFSEADNAVIVKFEDEGLALRKLDTFSLITRVPFLSNCQCCIHNRDIGLFSVIGSDSNENELNRLLVFRAANINIIKEFSSSLRKAVLSSAFMKTNSSKSRKSASHVANFFEVFYMGRARFVSSSKPLNPDFVDKAVTKLSEEISAKGGGIPLSNTFHGNIDAKMASNSFRPRSHTIGDLVEEKDLFSSKSLMPFNQNRTLLIQLTESEVFLISPTAKTTLLHVAFTEITAGCQGREHPECFAFLTSASDSLSTTENAVKPNEKHIKNQLFSPAPSSVTTLWAYIFCATDDHSSSNAVLSLRTCIREPFVLKDFRIIHNAANASNQTNNSNNNSAKTSTKIEGIGEAFVSNNNGDSSASLICDACPVRSFNAICRQLIDSSGNDDERLLLLSDYLNSDRLSSDDFSFVRQLLPRSAPNVQALIGDVIFALFQLAEYNRSSHVHMFNQQQEKTEKYQAINSGKSKMHSSTSFSGSSFVEAIKEKINLNSKRRSSMSDEEEKSQQSETDRIFIDLKQMISRKSSVSEIFRDYVVVKESELPTSPRKASAKAIVDLEETPKSAKSGRFKVPGSEPAQLRRTYARRCTVSVIPQPHIFKSAFRTPMTNFEPKVEQPIRLIASASTTPDLLSVPSMKLSQQARRRSIFEMVTYPSSSPQPQIPRLSESDLKQLDYEEPFGCQDEGVSEEWQRLIGLKPDISDEQKLYLEKLIGQGIPKQIRGKVWSWLIKRELSLLSNRGDNIPSVSPQEYSELLSTLTPCNQQILVDLDRTFPHHDFFAQHFGAGQLALFNILKAYSLIDPEVGYCQGISFVAGVLLMHCANEYDAFNLLLSLMFGFGLRSIYLPSMEGLHRSLYQLTRLLDVELPIVFEHLTNSDVLPVFFASPWFVTLFSSQFPLGFVVRVFDLLFYGNIEMIFRTIISLFSINEPLLLSRPGGFEDVVDFLKTTFTEMSVIQLERIVTKVFFADFAVQLNRFGVEYDIYREEQDISPVRLIENVALQAGPMHSSNGDGDVLQCLQHDYAAAKHKIVELRAERSGLLTRIDDMQTRIANLESELIHLESVNESLQGENAVLRSSGCSRRLTTEPGECKASVT